MAPPAPSPSLAPAPPRRRWGLIAAVLVVDLGLAVAGAALLHAGLATDDAPPAKTEPAVKTGSAEPKPVAVPRTEPPSPPPPPPPAALASGSDAIGSGSATTTPPPPPPVDDKKSARKKQPTKKKPKPTAGSGSGGPIDPYDAPDPLPPEQQNP